jgi:hypothetical protein
VCPALVMALSCPRRCGPFPHRHRKDDQHSRGCACGARDPFGLFSQNRRRRSEQPTGWIVQFCARPSTAGHSRERFGTVCKHALRRNPTTVELQAHNPFPLPRLVGIGASIFARSYGMAAR